MLGAGDYGVTLTEWSGRILWQSTDTKLNGLSFSRELSEVSQASLEAQMPEDVANLIEPWIYRLSIYRNDVLVWHGAVTKVRSVGRSVKLEAADGAVMFDRRRIPLNRTWRQHDATQAMTTMVEDGLGYLDPVDLVDNLIAYESRIWVTSHYVAGEAMVADAVSDFVDQGLVWTVAAGRLLIGPVGARRSTAQITDRDFDGEVAIVKDGTEMVTDALVVGKGVNAIYTAGVTPYGMLQTIEKDDGAVREYECEQAAKRLVDDFQQAPRSIEVSGASRLLPSAPITIEELIPGVRVPVASNQTGITVGSTMQLTKLDVDVSDSGETVKITLEETSVVDEPSELPDPAEMDWRSPYEREMASQGASTGGKTEEDSTDLPVPPA